MSVLTASAALALTGITFFSLFRDDVSDTEERAAAIGDVAAGAELIERATCGSCHMIRGIDGADGLVGPPLIHWSRRVVLQNTPSTWSHG